MFNLSILFVDKRRKSAACHRYYGEYNGNGNAYKQPNKLCAAIIALVFVYVAAKAPYQREYEAHEGDACQKVEPENWLTFSAAGLLSAGAA